LQTVTVAAGLSAVNVQPVTRTQYFVVAAGVTVTEVPVAPPIG
jgi:hypothetical protein